MKASRSASATMAATMAFSTNAAGPSLHSFSKMDAIAQPETRVCPVLRPLLIGRKARHILPRRYLEAQRTTEVLRGKPADLAHLCDIFCAGGEEHISGQPP